MNSRDIFENIIYYLKIVIIDETNTIHKQMENINSKFANIESLDSIEDIGEFNSSIVIANVLDEITEQQIIDLAKEYDDTTFLVINKDLFKDVRLSNIQTITNLKTIENKILKVFKEKYTKDNLCLRFSDGIYYNIKLNNLYDNNHQALHLTQRELDLLVLLLKNANNVVSHKTIQTKIWHESYEVSESAYKSLLNKLRGKIGKNSIKSISRKGYVINFH